MDSSSVELGFAEKRAAWKLKSKFFPSKIGGIPAWLSLNKLPNRSDLECKKCGKPLAFLMQVYAPIDDNESAFHRTIFIFICANGQCYARFNNDNFVVLRSQLPRKNEFYSFDPPAYKEKQSSEPSAEQFQPLCCICGCQAALKCNECAERDYCCEDHRACDWQWNHKSVCKKTLDEDSKKRLTQTNKFLLPEYELVTETEELPSETPEKSDEEKMKEYNQFMQSAKAPKELQDVPMDDYLDAAMQKKDKTFIKFQKRMIEEYKDQVLRYQKGRAPLWVSAEHMPSPADIPNCSCGAARVFEFQVMPQLLTYLKLDSVKDSIDWGTLAIYTCSKSCKVGSESYAKEFLWKQDFSDDNAH